MRKQKPQTTKIILGGKEVIPTDAIVELDQVKRRLVF